MRLVRDRHRLVVAAALSALLLAGCGGTGPTGGAVADDPSTIRIGLLSTLAGPFEPLGIAANQGAKLALIEAGGTLTGTGPLDTVTGATVAGKPVELSIVGSNNVSADIAVNAARRLIEENNVDVIVGPTSGDEGLAIKNLMRSNSDVTLVNGTAAAQNMTLRDPVSNVFRFSTDGAQWMAGLGSYSYNQLGYRNVATVAEDYSYPYDQVGGFLTEFCGAGGQVAKRIWMPLGTSDYASYINDIPQDIDAVYVALGGTDAVAFIRQFDEFTGRPLPIIGGTLTVDPAIISALGSRVEGVVSAGPVAVLNTPAYQQYAAALKKHYPDSAPPGFADVLYYVAMKATLLGLERAGGDATGNQAAFRTALAGLSFDTPQGPVKLDANRQVVANNYLFTVQGGQSTLLTTASGVNQTLGKPAEAYTSAAAFDRSNPACAGPVAVAPTPVPAPAGAP